MQNLVRCTGRTTSVTTTMPRTSEVALCFVEPWLPAIIQAGVSLGVITQEQTPDNDLPRISVGVFRIEISSHQDGESSVQIFGQVRLVQVSCGQEVDPNGLHWSFRQH